MFISLLYFLLRLISLPKRKNKDYTRKIAGQQLLLKYDFETLTPSFSNEILKCLLERVKINQKWDDEDDE